MAVKILPYDRSIVAQEYYWNCGPASAQLVLNSKGIIESEDSLIRAIGTTTRGTDFVGLIERVLNKRMPEAKFKSVYLERDPATAEQKEQLWRDVTSSIDAGYGVVMNFVAPVGNKPIGVRGSVSPAYSGGTTYHYVSCMGYNDDGGFRTYWIADPGFRPFGYYCSHDQVATLIPPKGYCFATAGPVPAPVDDPAKVLARAMDNRIGIDRYRALQPALSQCLRNSGCTTVARIAMWLAQVGHESGGLKWMEEIASGVAYNNRKDLGNGPSDGPRFKGRGPIMVTGRRNYTVLSEWAYGKGLVPTSTFFVDNPVLLSSDKYGFIGVEWYWTTQRPLNKAADARDLELATRYVNGGLNGLEDRRFFYKRALEMGDELLALVADGEQYNQTTEDYLMSEKLYGSVSIYKTPGEGERYSLAQLIQSIDGFRHRETVEDGALLGNLDDIDRIFRVAAGKGAYRDDRTIRHAKAFLARLEKERPEALRAYLESKGITA